MEARTKTHVSEDDRPSTSDTPRKPTLAENVITTIKVLAIVGLIGAALWGVDLWIAGR